SLTEYIQDCVAILRRRWLAFVLVFAGVVGSGIALLSVIRQPYETSAILMLMPDYAASDTMNATEDPLITLMNARMPNGYQAQLRMLQRQSVIREAEAATGLAHRPGIPSPTVTVEGERENNSIEIKVGGRDPRQVAQLANAMVDIHLASLEQSKAEGL